jgi:hypothetical protein
MSCRTGKHQAEALRDVVELRGEIVQHRVALDARL